MTDPYTCETNAYKRLKQEGVCEAGITPMFYGHAEIQPQDYEPHLDTFLNDSWPPHAILLEYIPHLAGLDYKTYTPERAKKFISGMDAIQAAGVMHGDVNSRKMMVADKGEGERLVYVGFDRAQTYEAGRVPERQRGWMEDEKRVLGDILGGMVGPFIYITSSADVV